MSFLVWLKKAGRLLQRRRGIALTAVVLVACAPGSGCSSGGGQAPRGGSGGSGGSGPTLDCHGQLSGAVTGTIDYCAQTQSIEQPSGKVTHGFVTTIDTNHDMNALFSFASEPPAPGSYDYTRFADFQVTVDLLTWSATWDARFDTTPTGNLTINLTGGSGTALTGSLHATAPITSPALGSGEVTVDLHVPLTELRAASRCSATRSRKTGRLSVTYLVGVEGIEPSTSNM